MNLHSKTVIFVLSCLLPRFISALCRILMHSSGRKDLPTMGWFQSHLLQENFLILLRSLDMIKFLKIRMSNVTKWSFPSCRPFFKQLVRSFSHPHPLIYMWGVKDSNCHSGFHLPGGVKFLPGQCNIAIAIFPALAEKHRLRNIGWKDFQETGNLLIKKLQRNHQKNVNLKWNYHGRKVLLMWHLS